jgi:hypothetical protein
MITKRGLMQIIYSEELISDQVTLEDLCKEVWLPEDMMIVEVFLCNWVKLR